MRLSAQVSFKYLIDKPRSPYGRGYRFMYIHAMKIFKMYISNFFYKDSDDQSNMTLMVCIFYSSKYYEPCTAVNCLKSKANNTKFYRISRFHYLHIAMV